MEADHKELMATVRKANAELDRLHGGANKVPASSPEVSGGMRIEGLEARMARLEGKLDDVLGMLNQLAKPR